MFRRLLVVVALGIFVSAEPAVTRPATALSAEPLWSVGGPEGANVTVLAADPQHPATIYAGTLDGGIWKTTDGAAHWTAAFSGLPTFSGGFLAINAIAVDPTVSSRVYAATNRGLFKSDDGAKTWTESGAGVLEGRFLNAIAIASSSSSTVFVGASSGVYRTTDAGVNWSLSNSGLVDSGGHTPSVLSIAIDPRDNRGIIAGTHDATFASVDGGASWAKFGGTALDGLDVTNVAFDPTNANTAYALSLETGMYRLVPPPTSSVAGIGIANPGWFKALWEK
ncbi:MAG TPA: hypothetical protein VG777_06330, partial [Thermoanaerobaculia bacterium]|nr:hypothetical protein [Thermoanaerobaculia bacterium]